MLRWPLRRRARDRIAAARTNRPPWMRTELSGESRTTGLHGATASVTVSRPLQRVARARKTVVSLCLLFASVSQLHAHTSLPGYLELKETAPNFFGLIWRVPTAEGPPPAIYPVFPADCTMSKELVAEPAPGSIIERGSFRCSGKGLNDRA